MGDTKIQWADKTWNPVRGCSVVSEGCRNCYAMTFAARFTKKGEPYEGLAYRNESGAHWTGTVRLIEEHLNDPLKWRKPVRVFVNSMSNLFHESIPDQWIDKIFAVMAIASQHTFQVLTKRPERMRDYFINRQRSRTAEHGAEAPTFYHVAYRVREMVTTLDGRNPSGFYLTEKMWPLPNVHLGVSVEDQKTANKRIHLLRDTPAAIRFISYEPALGPVDFYEALPCLCPCNNDGEKNFIDWLIVGGESGRGARMFDVQWARDAIAQCNNAGVPVFVKQIGSRPMYRVDSEMGRQLSAIGMPIRNSKGGDMSEWPEDLRVREFPKVAERVAA